MSTATSLYLVVALGAVVAGFVQGLSGFAFGLVAMSFWAWTVEPRLDVAVFKACLGGLLVPWCIAMLLARQLPRIAWGGRAANAVSGFLGGICGGVGGFTGPIPTLWCTLRGLERDLQRSVVQNFNLSMLAVAFALQVGTGNVSMAMLPLLGVVAVCVLIPVLLGARLYTGISDVAFRQVVLGLLTLSGVALLAASVPELLRRAH